MQHHKKRKLPRTIHVRGGLPKVAKKILMQNSEEDLNPQKVGSDNEPGMSFRRGVVT